jgi:hypothetical protein
MDIMNNMNVSTSKLTFSLIAIAALFISGSAMTNENAFAENPEFTAAHINTTATKITFSEAVNGTKAILDWTVKLTSTATAGVITSDALLSSGSVVVITNINNGTAPSEAEIAESNTRTGYASLGFDNDTTVIYLIHGAIPSDSTYFINYTLNPLHASITSQYHEAATAAAGSDVDDRVLISYNATAADHAAPLVVSAEVKKSNPNRIEVLMSETIANINATHSDGFTITKTTGTGYDLVPSTLEISNGTKYMYLDFHNTVNPGDVLTLSYATTSASDRWITDGINSAAYGANQQDEGGVGNRLVNFTGATLVNDLTGNRITNLALNIVNWLEIGMYGDVTTCYDCQPPTVTKIQVSLDSSTPITITDNNPVQINAGIDDTVSVMVTVADNLGADTIPFAGLYTNFGETPDNLYYANNFDSAKQMSTSYYEWNVRNDDVAFDNDGAITWTDATAKVNPDRTQTFTYTMTINDSITSSQVWVDIGDKIGNYAKIALPITLEVSGAPAITFASDDSQKVVSFFNESILLAIVSQWTATSSDDASNVEQLSSVLGIESQLPTWTTELASWVADDKIDVADMIVAVEYVINL